METTVDELVLLYQETGVAGELVKRYENYLRKYVKMFSRGEIDFSNYDLRKFLACYIKDRELIQNLIRGKFRSKESEREAAIVLRSLRRVFAGYQREEIYNDLVILLLECANAYKQTGKTFTHYLSRSFRYRVKRFIDHKMFDAHDKAGHGFFDPEQNEQPEFTDSLHHNYLDRSLTIDIDEQMDLNNLLWLNGNVASDVFQDLRTIERYILVKSFQDGYDDVEIARRTGFHHRSIYRVRKKTVEKFYKLWAEGKLKCIRL